MNSITAQSYIVLKIKQIYDSPASGRAVIENRKMCCSETLEALVQEIGNLKLEIGKKRMQKCRVSVAHGS